MHKLAHRAALPVQGPQARRAACRGTPTGPSPSTTGSRTATPRRCSPTRTGWPAPSSWRARRSATAADRRVVAVVGDGALTGGMAYEALNNLGHSGRRVVVVLNDNGRSYAPTVSHLLAEPHQPPAQPHLRADPRARPQPPARPPGHRRARLLGRPRRDQRAPRAGVPPHVLRGPGRPLRRADRRPRHLLDGAGPHPRRRVGRTDRRPRADPEGARLRPGRGGRGPATPRRQGGAPGPERERGRLGRGTGHRLARRAPSSGGQAAIVRPSAGAADPASILHHHLHRRLQPDPLAPGRGRGPRSWP